MPRLIASVFALLVAVARPVVAQTAPSLVIGGEEEKGVQIGSVYGLVEVGRRIVVMEGSAPFLHVLTLDGKLVQTLGARGQGPGEYERPVSLMTDGAGHVMIMDRNARLTTYSVGDTLALATMQRLPFAGMSACAAGRTVWVLRPDEKGILHEMRGTGPAMEVGRSVGDPEPPHPALRSTPVPIRRMYTSGALACDAARNTAWLVSWGFGDIRVIPLDGAPQRWIVNDDFVPELRDPNLPKGVDPPGARPFDQTIAAALVPDGLLFAVGRQLRDGGARQSQRTYRLPFTGAIGRLGASAWEPLLHTSSGLYCYRDDPDPTIARFAGARCP